MASRRASPMELNFDGLTDSVTNLAGTLILIALLLVGLTTEHVKSAPPQAAPPPKPMESEEGPRTVEELLLKIQGLRTAIATDDQEIERLEDRLAELRARAQQVLEKAGANAP